MKIFHIVKLIDWEAGTENGQFRASTLEKEGFIHCCKENQIQFVLGTWFSGQSELFLVTIETDKLESPVLFEKSEADQESFPHVYGPINLNAVVDIQPQEKESR